MSFIKKTLFFALFLAFSPLGASEAYSYGNEGLPSYVDALSELEKGRADKAEILVARSANITLNDVLLVQLMARPGNSYSFSELASFVIKHPDWPFLSGVRLIAEQKIPSDIETQQVLNWFTSYPPLTEVGFARYIEALNASGQADKAINLVRSRWIEKDFYAGDLDAFHSRYAPLLRAHEHRARLDRLLWDNKASLARKMYKYLGQGDKALAEARLALAQKKKNATKLLNQVPAAMRNNEGLLYERLKWNREKGLTSAALELLNKQPQKSGKPTSWWQERHILARQVMENSNFKLAYHLVENHGLSDDDGFDYIQAEFLAGWLALRLLHQPQKAEKHFQRLIKTATSPMSKARGNYWLGRAQEASGRKDLAAPSYEAAAAFNTIFYGQLAIAKLYDKPVIYALPEPAIPEQLRGTFFSRDVIQATEKLARLGDTDRAKSFFMAAVDYATQRIDFALLIELAHMMERPDWAIRTAKKAAQKGHLLTGAAYPILSVDIPTPPDIALTHALIRQESMFLSDAGSPVGAQGLMQLMPSTAKDIAKKLGLSYTPSRLTSPDFNLKLGTYFIQKQIDDFEGSLVLALAGYNAGPRRARQWVATYGDPRGAHIDPVDWIEMIPIYETRNYVQRVLESYQFYRARLNDGQAPLMILEDLKR